MAKGFWKETFNLNLNLIFWSYELKLLKVNNFLYSYLFNVVELYDVNFLYNYLFNSIEHSGYKLEKYNHPGT